MRWFIFVTQTNVRTIDFLTTFFLLWTCLIYVVNKTEDKAWTNWWPTMCEIAFFSFHTNTFTLALSHIQSHTHTLSLSLSHTLSLYLSLTQHKCNKQTKDTSQLTCKLSNFTHTLSLQGRRREIFLQSNWFVSDAKQLNVHKLCVRM